MTLAVRAGPRIVPVTRPDKPLFGREITKADLVRYYASVAPTMLPHLAGRPLNLERYPTASTDPHHPAARQCTLSIVGPTRHVPPARPGCASTTCRAGKAGFGPCRGECGASDSARRSSS